MKILFDHALPFSLAHGGFEIQVEQTMAAVAHWGVEVEPMRWWDATQRGDVIHYFGRPVGSYVDFAHGKGLKVVVAELHSALGSRSAAARAVQKTIMRVAQTFAPESFVGKLAWDTYRKADAFVANTSWEASLIAGMFDADPARIQVIPNGVEDVFRRPHRGGDYLVCTAAIHPRKRVLELAQAAAHARVPVWIIGKPYAETDPYYLALLEAKKASPDFIRYEGPVSSREALAEIYANARGFVLPSTQETLSLSSYEAAAAGCPLLLSDLPWARSAFGAEASYVSPKLKTREFGEQLKKFHLAAATLPATFNPPTWPQVGKQFVDLYTRLLG